SGNNNTTSNSATLTVTNNPNGTISGNIYVQNISELSGAVVNNTVNTVIRVYNTGSSTSIMNINNSNGIFSISSLQNGNYDIQVEHNYNGHTFKTKRTNVPVNSNLDLYISSYIYQQILNYNAILENIDCYLEDINEYKDIYSYNLQSSNSYINSKITLNNNDLQDNEALLRLAMGERLLIKYLNQAKTMGQEYVMCIDDFAEILFAITKIITCNGSNVTRIPMEFIAERFKDIIKIPINNMNSPHRNLYTTIIDGVFDIATDANISTSTVYNAGIKPIIQRKCINDILSRIYVPNTYHIDNSMVLKSQSYNFSGNLSTTVSNNNYKLSNSLSNTAYIQGFSEGSRNNPDWVVWTRDFFTIAASTTCYRGWFYTVLGLGTNVVQMGILSNAIYKDTKRVNQLIDEVEITTNGSYQRDGIQNNVSKINGIDIIANIVDSFNNEYNLTINELSLNQNNNLYSHLMNLIRINNNLDFYTNEVIKHINAVYPYSNFSDTIYNELLKYTIIGSPLTRLSHLLCLNYYYDNQTEADLRDSIIIHSNDISLTNSNMLIELSTLYPLLDSTNTPGYVAIYENTIPKKMQTNEIKTVNVKFKNYGKSNADDVKIIYTIDEPYHFSIDTLILGTILPDSIISIPVNISSSSFSDTFSLYSVQIESSNANTKHLGGAIFTNSKLTTINSNTSIKKQLSVFPNPNNGSFSIQFETLNNENELSVINNIGQQVYFEKLSNSIGIQTKEIKLNNLPNGIYNIQIKSGRDISIQKIVIN
ncbi:MAG TPA: T9SS type A sorting domain-containing protein, partial [Flavobacterium sp.]|nr:T9SS type A sorting domain-containing protein [Flavobacterium sp.]